ncbi:nuclease-related domain-containing protein [Alkalibacillus sp. S2W]|uniref:nuclease-related domain-containing protein n=1 Tax=Alkalibacillus sp. S2W TaxID=3386553 RepID=UPI00398CAFC7
MTTILREKSPDLELLEVIMPRLDASSPYFKELKERYLIESAGYEGEQSIYYYINQIQSEFFHLHGLYFQAHRSKCQIDHLLIFPHCILILETKHYKGELRYHSQTGIFEQKVGNRSVRRRDPIAQAEMQRHKLTTLIKSSPYPVPPIQPLVVLTHDEAIPTIEGNEPNMIISQRLLQRIDEVVMTHAEAHNQEDYLENLAQFIVSHHENRQSQLLNDYPGLLAHIKSGVRCTGCGDVFMERTYSNWICPTCHHQDRSAHIPALRACRLIFGDNVTCQLVAKFLAIPPHTARRLLKRTAKQIGEKRGASYILV